MAEPSSLRATAESEDRSDAAGGADTPPSSLPPLPRRRWASQELGELVAKAWSAGTSDEADPPAGPLAENADPGAVAPPPPEAGLVPEAGSTATTSAADAESWPASGGWEVDKLPSEAEGGIVGLLLNDRRAPMPGGAVTVMPAGSVSPFGSPAPAVPIDGAPAPRLGSLPPAWGLAGGSDVPGTGLARLTEMLDQLPEAANPRVTPADVDLEPANPAPPAVWFWGDDDIYPGKVVGAADSTPGRSLAIVARDAGAVVPVSRSPRLLRRKR